MTLNLRGIVVEDEPTCTANPVDQFWLAACQVYTEIVRRRPDIQTAVGSVVDAGGDIEITAHNQPRKISLALRDWSGDRHVVLDDAGQILQQREEKNGPWDGLGPE